MFWLEQAAVKGRLHSGHLNSISTNVYIRFEVTAFGEGIRHSRKNQAHRAVKPLRPF
jgi:hypothetical protein